MSSEEDVHYISDQDSGDDKPQIESIIKEKTKIFKNESYAIKIMLSEHLHKVRSDFFSKIRRVHSGIYQAIKREIRNCLNPYRIFTGKDTKIKKELQELYELLKIYYKEKNFNNTFFINYFKDLEKAHSKESKSKFINMLPKDEIETLNDIQRKVTIIKSLRHYLNTSIRDRIQINFEQKKEMYEEDDFIMMFKYMTIKEKEFSEMGEEKLMEYISNKKGSYKLRRPLNDFNVYNYLPILCKGYCLKEAKLFIQFFQIHAQKCKICKVLHENFEEVEKQIKSLYIKTCIFSHNINEIMFHPLVFFSFSNVPFYSTQLQKEEIKEIKNIVEANKPSKKYMKIKKGTKRTIYNPADNGMKKIYNKLKEYSSQNDLYGNICYLAEYKTSQCPLDLFMPNTQDFTIHINMCQFYHSSLEKRRNEKIKENEICKEVIKDGKWKNDEENIKCKDLNNCNKFHTRNEVFYDKRNYRKLYPCSCAFKYCEKGALCPRKHPTDMKIEEIYLPKESKNELERELKKLIDKEKKIRAKIKEISKIQCKSCLNFIDGKERNLYIFKNCNHVICSLCFNYYKSCPLCGLNNRENNDDDEEDKNFIELDYEFKSQNQENEKEQNDEYEEEENDEEYGDEDNEENKDKDIQDIGDNEDETDEEDEILFKTNNDISIDEKNDTNDINSSKPNNHNYTFDEDNENNYNNHTNNNISMRSRGSKVSEARSRGRRGGRKDRLYKGFKRGGQFSSSNYNDESSNYNSRGRREYKRGREKKSSYYNDNEKENNSISNKSEKSDEIGNSLQTSMIENEQRGEENRRGKGKIRGRRGRGRGLNKNYREEEDSKSSDEEKDCHINYNISKKISDNEVNELSD